MRILVVEDNRDILINIIEYLENEGYNVDSAQDGLSGLHLAATHQYDLIVLDIMLPGIDGYLFCQRLRNDARLDTPILMLTARDALEDRLRGLRFGADDYLVKPFSLAELVARIEAITRRSQGKGVAQLYVSDLVFDPATHQVSRSGQILKLNPMGIKLLVLLMKKSPAVVKREDLELEMWGEDIPDRDSLRSHIHQLRQVVDKPFTRPLIHTVHGIGYRLAELEA
ncbi:response regulator transcription factor [Microbulbifer variabilis]|uniref:response regulator transcription factor n=1 Tax=Microbulbifer variabilis TaxID=266805 RepID=UPI001CFD25CB|nr:response regulator transcription factor [Microbulbifer variabilis]